MTAFSARICTTFAQEALVEGRITHVRADKGYGFIRAAGQVYFFHRYDLSPHVLFGEDLHEQLVQFDRKTTDRGPAATNVRPL